MKQTTVVILLAIAFVPSSPGQNAIPPAKFDVASLKIAPRNPTRGVSGTTRGGPGTSDPGRITYTQHTLWQLLSEAWNIEASNIIGPDWLKHGVLDFYTVTATMPPATTKPQFQLMLQNLLIERFKIRFHHEVRRYPVYRLVIAPGGPKLKKSADPDAPDPADGATGVLDADGFLVLPPGHGEGVSLGNGVHAKFQNFTLAEFVVDPHLKGWVDSSWEANHIVDETGLVGKYDFTLRFENRPGNAANVVVGGGRGSPDSPREVSSAVSAPSGLPDLSKAIEQQLGLRLVRVKEFPLDSIVIDYIERVPVEN